MCGINGIVRFGSQIAVDEILRMNKEIKHRGPDDEGAYAVNTDEYSIGLGHVRLAIIDLSEKGHQPMGYSIKEDRIIYRDSELDRADVIIVYNGEIYNFVELKEKFNIETETGTDTEVILKMYHELGEECVKHLNGMWAFCIFDKVKRKLFCSRDRLGQKPFYYYWDGKELIFSSELKGIVSIKKLNKKENINKKAIELYLGAGFIPAPYTIYKSTYKLEPAHNLVLSLDSREIHKEKYWELPRYAPIYNKDKLVKEIREVLVDATRIRLRSDVPVGAFLSGGLDSSTVVGIMAQLIDIRNLHTFSIGFEGKYDETPYIQIVASKFGTNHHHYYFTKEDFEKLVAHYVWIYDEPFADYSGFPTYKVSEIARNFVTVSLSGDGGDEIFGGYYAHVFGRKLEMYRKIVPKLFRISLIKILTPLERKSKIIKGLVTVTKATLEPDRFYEHLSGSLWKIAPKEYVNWLNKTFKEALSIANGNISEALRIQDMLYKTLPDNFLTKVDRASMAVALEVRSPFLDYRLIEIGQKIPNKWRVGIFQGKKFMRYIISEFVPKEILKRKKQGFSPPIDKWISEEKYVNIAKESLKILQSVTPELYNAYKDILQMNPEKWGKYERIQVIRLALLGMWWERWIARN